LAKLTSRLAADVGGAGSTYSIFALDVEIEESPTAWPASR